jgi:trans-2,3-dihydro-3-hydroxyanthranilate isomerase
MAGPILVVEACTRQGRGGSPTAVLIDDGSLADAERQAIARATGTSHTAFVDTRDADLPSVRFFTAERELGNCGHGVIAAQAVLLLRRGAIRHRGRQRCGGRTFATTATRRREGFEVWFDQGVIALPPGAPRAGDDIVAALGLLPGDLAADPRIASPGTPRLLVAVRDRRKLLAMGPDFPRLATECRRLGLLGCFTYALLPTRGTVAARMFAPAIGVDEDIANANSAGCLAAHLLDTTGAGDVEVHQGDRLGRPSSVFATATRTAAGLRAEIGGLVTCP